MLLSIAGNNTRGQRNGALSLTVDDSLITPVVLQNYRLRVIQKTKFTGFVYIFPMVVRSDSCKNPQHFVADCNPCG